MRHTIAKLALLCLLLPAFCAARAQTDSATTTYNNLAVSTSLKRPGLRPWHLVLSFQLYDLTGKKQETGTIEEWWVSPQSHRLVITSPSYNYMEPSDTESSSKDDVVPDNAPANSRESYLVRGLLDQVLVPMHTIASGSAYVAEEKKTAFGKIHLNCFSRTTKGKPAKGFLGESPLSYCVEPDTFNLLIYYNPVGGLAVERRQLATFQNTDLAMNNSVSYYGKTAIDGTILKLESFDPTKSSIKFQTQSPEPADKPTVVAGGVIAGRRIGGSIPEYPDSAKMQHRGGSVILHAIITEQGTIKAISVIASPAEDLANSAVNAVKTWRYLPYLLNGKPTSIDTTITVNFNLN